MLVAEERPIDPQRLLIAADGLLRVSQIMPRHAEVVVTDGHVGMLVAEGRPIDLQRLLIEADGLLRVATGDFFSAGRFPERE